ncbi:unnamed protein product [Auanema sp. JU1783]|nr:unnamed protein product [Auanema sp. JU1783]
MEGKLDNADKINDDDDYGFEDYAGEGIPIIKLIPAACEANLTHSDRPISALKFEPNGQRFGSGGMDYQLKIFDFQKMDMSLRSDKELTPAECHVINSITFSANGENCLICSGEAMVKLIDRTGKQWAETVKGDQYLVDVKNTKGHTAAVNCGVWNPIVKNEFLTCSDDGTVRFWNLDEYKVITKCFNKHLKIIKVKNAGGKRAMPQTCCYAPDGKMVAAGCDDGSIQAWKYGSLYVNPNYLVRNAHKGPITSIAFSHDSQRIVTRGLDDSMKIWSIKDCKKPLHEIFELENAWKSTDCGFSPRGELIYTGTSSPSRNIPGYLLFYNAETYDLVYRIDYPGVSVHRIDWHPKMNQILVGFSDGSIKIYYDQEMSEKGILGCVSKPIKRSRADEVVREEMVLSPLTLEMFQPRGEEGEEKEVSGWRLRKYLRMRDNQIRPEFRKPADVPMDGPSANGRVAASGSTLHSYLARQIGTQRNKEFLQDTDVRASILRHADEAAKNPLYIDKAYRKNQPKPIFQEKTTAPEEDEEEKELQPVFKMPRHR